MLLHQINPNMEYERTVDWMDLQPGWFILNLRDTNEQATVVGPFDTEADLHQYIIDTSDLFGTERIIKVV